METKREERSAVFRYVICERCQRIIDRAKESHFVEHGMYYHEHCLDNQKTTEKYLLDISPRKLTLWEKIRKFLFLSSS